MRAATSAWAASFLCLAASGATAQTRELDATPVTKAAPASRPIDVLAALRPQPGGMTAEDAARRAVQRAPTVASAREACRQAEAAASAAKLRLLPRVDLSASYQRLSDIEQPPFEFAGQTFDNPFPVIVNHYDTQAKIAVPVTDIFLSQLPSYRSAKTLIAVARYRTEAEQQDIAFRARQTYFNVAEAKAAELVAQDSVRLLEANVRDIEALAQAGVVTRADVQRTRAQAASARVRLARVRASLAVQLASFVQVIAGGEPVPTTLGENLLQLPPRRRLHADQLVHDAFQRRPELLALQAIIRARRDTVSVRRARTLPRLDLSGQLLYARPNARVVPPKEEFRASWAAGAVLSWSPNDLLTGNQEVTQAEHELAQARHDLRALQDGITIEVAGALANYNAASEAISAANEALQAAHSNYENRQDLLAAGEATTSEFLEAETELRKAQLDVVAAYVALRKALAEVDKAIGQAAPHPA